ncbi:hypothetical protein [Amycolatopsis pittospori]|uniref:hypothetical protein n=1 Tax=Amycolatopsis pittospori TaxID=2749434 RepID=UPI0015F00B5E|nr:hypothetical protein [Amycolatopsis pittospori]
MSADETAGVKATLDALVREQADRRALREQRADEIKAQGQEYMTKQVQTAQRYVEHRRELGQRKTKSGWSTDRSHAEPGAGSTFDEPMEAVGEPAPFPSPARPGQETPRRTRRPRPAEVDDEDDAFLNNRWAD